MLVYDVYEFVDCWLELDVSTWEGVYMPVGASYNASHAALLESLADHVPEGAGARRRAVRSAQACAERLDILVVRVVVPQRTGGRTDEYLLSNE